MLAIMLFFGVTSSVWALPLWTDSPITIEGTTYYVSNHALASDQFNSDYYGYSSDDYSGYYLGTISGNTDMGQDYPLASIIRYYYFAMYAEEFEILSAFKVESEESSDSFATVGPLTVSWDEDLQSGLWEFDVDSSLSLGFYTVKGGDAFALYYVDPGQQSGIWTTRHLLVGNARRINHPELSHFTGVPTTIHAAPEPTTLLLLGFGLLGLGVVARQRKNN